jgi:hypothetical protein
MEARLRGPVRDAEQLGDPRDRQIEIEVQDDDRSRLRLEASQRTIEQVAIRDLPGLIERFGEVQGG